MKRPNIRKKEKERMKRPNIRKKKKEILRPKKEIRAKFEREIRNKKYSNWNTVHKKRAKEKKEEWQIHKKKKIAEKESEK